MAPANRSAEDTLKRYGTAYEREAEKRKSTATKQAPAASQQTANKSRQQSGSRSSTQTKHDDNREEFDSGVRMSYRTGSERQSQAEKVQDMLAGITAMESERKQAMGEARAYTGSGMLLLSDPSIAANASSSQKRVSELDRQIEAAWKRIDVLNGGTSGADRAAALLLGSGKQYASGLVNAFGMLAQGNANNLEFQRTGKLDADVSNPAVDKIFNTADELQASGSIDTAKAKAGLGALGRFGVDAASAGVQLAGETVLGTLTGGGLLPAVVRTTRAFGGLSGEARQDGADYGEQLAYGIAGAVAAALIENISNISKPLKGAFGPGVTDDAVAAAINRTVDDLAQTEAGKRLFTTLATAGASATGEGFEEAVEAIIDTKLKRMTYDPDAQWNLDEILYEGLVGAAVGFVPGLAGSSVDVKANTAIGAQAEISANPTVDAKPGVQSDPIIDALLNRNSTQQNQATGAGVEYNSQRNASPVANTNGVDGGNARNAPLTDTRVTQNIDNVSPRYSAVDADASAHTPEQQEVITQYNHSVDNGLMDFVEKIKNLKDPNYRNRIKYTISDVTNRAVNDIRNLLNIDVSGYEHVVTGDAVNHIENRHGINGVNDHSMANIEDVARIGYVLDNYDSVNLLHDKTGDIVTSTKWMNSDNTNAPLVQFQKRIDGTYYVVEAVPVNKTRQMAIVSAYMTKANGSTDPVLNMPQSGPQPTPHTPQGANTSVYNIIPQSPDFVNSDVAQQPNNLPEGMGAASNPYSSEQNTSRVSSNTFENSGIYAEVDRQAEGVGDAIHQYDVITERESMGRAQQRLEFDFEGELAALPTKADWTGEDLDTAMGILDRVVSEARQTNDYSEVKRWAKLIQESGTRAGQMVQAFAKYTRTPEGVLVRAAETLASSKADSATVDTVLGAIAEFANTLDAINPNAPNTQDDSSGALVDLIVQQAAQRNTKVSNATLQALKAQDVEYLYNFALAQLDAIANDYASVTTGKRISTYQTMAHLLNFRTGARNLISNQVFDIVDSAASNVAMIPDVIIGTLTGNRTVGFNKSWFSEGKRQGAVEGARRAWAEVALDVDAGNAQSKYGSTARRTFKRTGNALERGSSTAEKIMGFELNVTDEFHKGSVAGEVMESLQPYIDNGSATVEQARAWAEQEALFRSFQDDTFIGKFLADIKTLFNHMGIKDFGVGDFIQKYTQVPGALITRAIEYSPMGYAKAIYTLAKAQINGGIDMNAQRTAALAFGRATTGTGLITAFASLAAAGVLSRAEDEDKADVAALNSAEGIHGTQLNITALERLMDGGDPTPQRGDTLMSIEFLEPLNSLMTTGALIAQGESGGLIGSTMEGIFRSIQDLPTMQTLSSVFNVIQYHDEDSLSLWAEIPIEIARSGLTGFIPSPIRQLAQASDDYYRELYGQSNPLLQALDSFKYGIPGLRQTLPVKLDNFGQPKSYGDNRTLNVINALLSPGSINQYRQSDVSQELSALRDETGNASIYPGRRAPNSISYGGESYTLTGAERQQYQQTRGQLTYELMEQVMSSEAYGLLSNEERLAVLSDIKNYANDSAKRELVTSRGGEYSSNYDRQNDIPDIGSYLVYKEAFNAVDKARGDSTGAFETLIQRYDTLDEDTQAALSNITGFDKAKAAVDAGISISDYYTAKDTFNAVEDSSGSDNATFDSLFSVYTKLDRSQQTAITELVGGSFGNLMKAYSNAVSPALFYEAQDEYRRLNSGDSSASDKAAEFAHWMDTEKLAGIQKKAIGDIFNFYSHIPADTDKYDSLVDGGLSPDTALTVYEILAGIEPQQGHENVRDIQRAEAIIGAGLSNVEALTVIDTYLSDSNYNKAKFVTDSGYSLDDFVQFWINLDKIDQAGTYNSGGPGTFSQKEAKAALDGMNLTKAEKALFWALTGDWVAYNNPYDTRYGKHGSIDPRRP